jgi:hypothetical protein
VARNCTRGVMVIAAGPAPLSLQTCCGRRRFARSVPIESTWPAGLRLNSSPIAGVVEEYPGSTAERSIPTITPPK